MRILTLVFLCLSSPAMADKPIVLDVTATQTGPTWRFDVQIMHEDEGWDHYADGWGVYLSDGTELGYRVLHHPHVNEMPFTRSLSGVSVPEGAKEVLIRPRDLVHGVGKEFRVPLN